MNNNYTHPPTVMVFRNEDKNTELIYCTLEVTKQEIHNKYSMID